MLTHIGDREHHAVTVHLAMPLHALFLVGLVRLPVVTRDIMSVLSRPVSRSRLAGLAMGICLTSLGLVLGSRSHPFLLADNRDPSLGPLA